MTGVLPIALLILTGFLIGGVISFARNRQVLPAVLVGVAALLSAFATWMWW